MFPHSVKSQAAQYPSPHWGAFTSWPWSWLMTAVMLFNVLPWKIPPYVTSYPFLPVCCCPVRLCLGLCCAVLRCAVRADVNPRSDVLPVEVFPSKLGVVARYADSHKSCRRVTV